MEAALFCCRDGCVGLGFILLIWSIGGGLWHPEAAPTAAMRRDIDRNARRLKDILMDDRMRREFFAGAAKNERKVVKAFVAANSENALKTKPKVSALSGDRSESILMRPSHGVVCRLDGVRAGR